MLFNKNMNNINYIKPTHLHRLTGEKIELIGYSEDGAWRYYAENGEVRKTYRRLDETFIPLPESEKVIMKCNEKK